MNDRILSIDGWMQPVELDWLYSMAQKVPDGGLIVEIGAWLGRSSAALYEGAGNRKTVVTIDTWKGQPDLIDTDHQLAKNSDLFGSYMDNMYEVFGTYPKPYERGRLGPQYIIGDSVESASFFEDQSIDMWFDDGDHTRLGEDIDAYEAKIRGILSGHDYFCFYETIQQEIHKRFWVNGVVHSIWWRYANEKIPGWL